MKSCRIKRNRPAYHRRSGPSPLGARIGAAHVMAKTHSILVVLVLSLFACGASACTVAAQQQPPKQFLQWSCFALVRGATAVPIDQTPEAAAASVSCGLANWQRSMGSQAVYSEDFPYTVPRGKALGVVGVQVSSKMRADRAGYFVVGGVASLPTDIGQIAFQIPIVVPGGATITAMLINNAPAADDGVGQWMWAGMQAILVDATPATPYGQIFPSLWK